MTPDSAAITVRALAFVALFQALGGVLFLLLFREFVPRTADTLRRLTIGCALSGVVLLGAHQGVTAARMAGDWAGLKDAYLQRLAWSDTDGLSHLVAMSGLLLLACSLARQSSPRLAWAGPGVALVVGAFVLTGHTSVHSWRALLAPLLAAHVLLGAFWFGALAPLVLACRQEPHAQIVALLQRFSALAVRGVPGIAVAGVLIALMLTGGNVSVLQRPYGQLLLVKAAAFAILMLLAVWNRWQLTLRIAAGETTALTVLARSILLELLILVTVLTVTAALTTLYSP